MCNDDEGKGYGIMVEEKRWKFRPRFAVTWFRNYLEDVCFGSTEIWESK